MSTLNENILKVKETFEDIASAIEEQGVDVGECDSPTTYASKIRSIVGSGGGLDPNKLYVEAYDAGDANPTVTASSSDDGGVILTFGLKRGAAGTAGTPGKDGRDGKDGADGAPGAQGPAGIPGQDGADGMDGSVYEYVYFRGFSEEHKPSKPASGVGNHVDDYVPAEKNTVSINGNSIVLTWSDKAQGVDETYKFEWRSERKKSGDNKWEDFTTPVLWAKYGEKGKDGDGVQYIFTTTERNSAPANPTPADWETNSEYQNNEADEYWPSGWSDDPIEVDSTNKYCWTSVRKYRNGKWGRYSDPTTWTKWVESSGTVTADVVVIDMDPDFVMVNSDDNSAETTITAFRGDDPIIIQDVTCESGNYSCNITSSDNNKTWKVVVSNIQDSVSIKVNVKLSETSTRTKTFSIYHTKNDSETVSVDFGDDNILVPCSDGSTPDAGFFNNLEIPVMMKVAGQPVTATSIVPDSHSECFEITSAGNIKVKSFPGNSQKTSVKFTVSDGTNTAVGYVNFTKFNTAGGTIAMYTLNINANDIVCDTRNNANEYKVYSGKQGISDNKIKALVNKYSSKEGNTVIEVSALPSTYAVYYANDPEDWSEDASSTIGEYLPITDNGIEIGNDIAPDKCVSFQLREWIGQGTPWSDMSEGNYKVWDSENILVDIIRDIASYQFVITPNKIHRKVNGEITVPENKQITVGLSKNKAGDGETKYEALSAIPTGYDIYYEIDNNGDPIPFGGESENVTLPYTVDVSDVTNSVVFTLVVNENSEDNTQVVLSETVEITSDVPGESAYVGYVTDSMCTVSCDANGIPTQGQLYNTEFKVTNGTVTNVNIPSGSGYKAEFKNGKVYFSDFTQELPEVTKLTLTATCIYSDGLEGEEEAGYTIVKLKVADASTLVDFSNDNIIIPCDENGVTTLTSISTYVTMLHGDEALNLTTTDTKVNLGTKDSETGYYNLTLGLNGLTFDGDVCNYPITFTGTDAKGNTYTKVGQLILTKVKAGESGQIWDLVLTTNFPKYDNATDKFDDDYVEGWVNIWGSDNWSVASYQTLADAGRYIVYKTNETTSTYTAATSSDFVNNRFRIYINPTTSGKAYVDLDNDNGVVIALAKKEGDAYIPIQEEIMKASFDGRDFGKFELMLSDEIINKHTDANSKVTYSPTEIKINGIFEYSGMDRTQYEKGQTHNKHIAGLDVYYSKDHEYKGETVVDESWMHQVGDIANNGIASDDVIPVDNASEYINVYLVAHYKESENTEEILKIIDDKLIRVISTVDGTNGIGTEGNGIVSITKRFAVNNDPKNHPTGNWTEDMPLTSSENRYLWCEETTTYTKSNPTTIHYIVAVHGEPGAGGTGNDAPIIYPAGVWDDEKTYVSIASDPANNVSGKIPYVFYASEDSNEGYYVLKEGAAPPMGTVPTNTTYWDPIDSFEAIYADIGLFNQALVGKWVFHGDYMFSQEGIGYKANNNTKQTRYDSFSDPSVAIDNWYSNKYSKVADKDWFKPNVCFNAITGESVLGKSTFDTNSDTIGNKVTIDGNVINIANSEGTAAITLINDSIKHKDLLIDNTMRTFDNAVSNVNLHLPTNAGPIDCYLYYNMHKIGYIEADYENPVTLKVLAGSGVLTITDFDNGAVWSGLSSSTIRIICVDDNGTKTTVKTINQFGPKNTTSSLAKGQERGCTWTDNSISLTKSGTYYIEPWIKQQFKWTKESSGDVWGNFNIDLSVSLDYTSGAENKLFIGNDGIVTASAYGFSKLTDTDAQMIFDTWGFAVSSNGIMFTKDGGFVWNKLKFNDNGSVSWEQTHWEGNSWTEVENNTPSNGTASSIGMWD